MKTIRIVGGGLAGLSLGIALRRSDVPVTVTEAADYPRHRVCGEFISGAGQQFFHSLGLEDVLRGAVVNRKTAWFDRNRLLFSETLRTPALGLSRFQLDRGLADCFRKAGGKLITRTRLRRIPEAETILACGRRGGSHEWIGLKLHCHGLNPPHDLTMHFGAGGYVGVSRIEKNKANVCGLFRVRRDLSPGKAGILVAYLQANGLTDLSEQVSDAEIDPASLSATTALDFTENQQRSDHICIGDFNTAIPPFTGNGMSMALETAEVSLAPLLAFAQETQSWQETRHAVHHALHRRFRARLTAARLLHPVLLRPAIRSALGWTVSRKLLPLNFLFHLLR